MSGHRKYSNELKLEIVEKNVKEKIPLKQLAKKYNIDYSMIRRWRDAYLEHGMAGLSTTNRSYTGDFKVSVVEYMHTTGLSTRQAAAHFNIPNPETISKWERIYYEEGPIALYEEHRGRTSKMGKRGRKPKASVDDNEDLLAEVQRLRMENEYLKKLNALVQEREKSEKKTK